MKAFQRRIFQDLTDGALVLTVNKRLCRHVRRFYETEMAREGRLAWSPPQVFTLEQWLRSLLAEGGEEWRLLDRFGAQRLWEETVEAEAGEIPAGILQVPATARRAMEAHQLLIEYGAEPPETNLTEDQKAFLRWRRSFLETCRSRGWIDPASLLGKVEEIIAAGRLELPERILLAGFDEVTPAVRNLGRVLESLGIRFEEITFDASPPQQIARVCCSDTREEVRQAARWARCLLDRGEEDIGVVVPRLSELRNCIERIFQEQIDPGSILSVDSEEQLFGLSLGSPLADEGPIWTALELLALEGEVPLEAASRLLRTPYLGGSISEHSSRALLESRLRSFGSERVKLARLATLSRQASPGRSPRFARICDILAEKAMESGRRTPGEWAEFFSELLEKVGWPGERSTDSREFQVLSAWREKLLPALIGLDRVCPPLGRAKAVGLLRRLAAETEFHAETPESPIQVVGLLEAAGLEFDHLWILGLSEEVLPAPASPNPFLPRGLQSELGMPHADAGREKAFASRIAARLFAAAPQIVVSHPRRRGDCELRPSPLIRPFPEGEVELAPSSFPAALIAAGATALEIVSDDTGPRLPAGVPAAGGTSILKDQALCPFRAFVRHRLSGRALEAPTVGIDPRMRGSLLHGALETFWAQTVEQQRLLAMDDGALAEKVQTVVASTVDSLLAKGIIHLPEAVIEIEKDRLCALVLEWLQLEKERSPFTVMETEQEHLERFGELTIRTQIDRVDRIGGEHLAVIDYKTGRIDLDDVLGERLTEPQLPIYGIGEREANLAGIGFGIVRRGECAMKGICKDEDILPKTEAFEESKAARRHGIESWQALLGRWRRQLEDLADEFVEGRAAVAPFDPVKACRYCDLPPLCRIDEIAPEEGE